MKPRELYSGPAPSAMGMMGQGLIEAGGNIGRTLQQGYESLGKGIASGIQAAGAAYGDMKKLDAESKASEKMYNTLKEGGYLDPKLTAAVDAQAEAMKHASTQERNAFWKDQKAFLGGAVSQKFALDRIQADTASAVERGAANIVGGAVAGYAGQPQQAPVQPMVVGATPDAGLPSNGANVLGGSGAEPGVINIPDMQRRMDAPPKLDSEQQDILDNYKKTRRLGGNPFTIHL